MIESSNICLSYHLEPRRCADERGFYLSETVVDGWAVCAFCAVVCASPVLFSISRFFWFNSFFSFSMFLSFSPFHFSTFPLSNGLRANAMYTLLCVRLFHWSLRHHTTTWLGLNMFRGIFTKAVFASSFVSDSNDSKTKTPQPNLDLSFPIVVSSYNQYDVQEEGPSCHLSTKKGIVRHSSPD